MTYFVPSRTLNLNSTNRTVILRSFQTETVLSRKRAGQTIGNNKTCNKWTRSSIRDGVFCFAGRQDAVSQRHRAMSQPTTTAPAEARSRRQLGRHGSHQLLRLHVLDWLWFRLQFRFFITFFSLIFRLVRQESWKYGWPHRETAESM